MKFWYDSEVVDEKSKLGLFPFFFFYVLQFCAAILLSLWKEHQSCSIPPKSILLERENWFTFITPSLLGCELSIKIPGHLREQDGLPIAIFRTLCSGKTI